MPTITRTTLLFLFILAARSVAACPSALQRTVLPPDIAPWAETSVRWLQNRHILFGYPDGKFHGAQPVRREEAALALARLFHQTEKFDRAHSSREVEVFLVVFAPATLSQAPEGDRFKDTDPKDWRDPVGQELAQAGIVNGYPDGSFQRNRWLTRAELAALVARYQRGLERQPTLDMRQACFRDVAGDEWWFGAELVAAGTGILKGYADHCYRGDQLVTRNELATALARLAE